ncbi:MAG: hypothetical protein GQ569_14025 [Methylococcaceae bacterium]|nr:hypothetical protein [Methylococcaceae bacterium]
MRHLFYIFYLPLLFQISPVKAEEYTQYCNGRYGFCVDYLTDLGRKPAPDNGDGVGFYDYGEFIMSVSGSNNVQDETLAEAMQERLADFDQVSYKKRGKNWLVLSGYQSSNILYIKVYLGKGSSNTLYLQYPKSLKKSYDAMVSRASRSFKAGNLNDSH